MRDEPYLVAFKLNATQFQIDTVAEGRTDSRVFDVSERKPSA